MALLLLFKEEPALRFPYERLGDDLHSEFLIRAHGAMGDELKSVVEKWLNEKTMTSAVGIRRSLKRSKPLVFLDSPDIKKRMRSKRGELQSILSDGPSYIMHAGHSGINMYAVDAVDTCTEEHTQCHLATRCVRVFPVRPGRSASCEV